MAYWDFWPSWKNKNGDLIRRTVGIRRICTGPKNTNHISHPHGDINVMIAAYYTLSIAPLAYPVLIYSLLYMIAFIGCVCSPPNVHRWSKIWSIDDERRRAAKFFVSNTSFNAHHSWIINDNLPLGCDIMLQWCWGVVWLSLLRLLAWRKSYYRRRCLWAVFFSKKNHISMPITPTSSIYRFKQRLHPPCTSPYL